MIIFFHMCWNAKLICSIQLWTIEKWDHEWRDVDISRNNSWVSYRAFFYLLLSLCECNQPMRCDKRYCNISTWTSNTFKSWFTRCYHSFFISMLSQTACALSLHSALNIIGIFVAFICGAESTSHTHNITSHKRIAEMRKKYCQLMVKWHTKKQTHCCVFFTVFNLYSLSAIIFFNVYGRIFRSCMNIFVNIIGIVNVVFIESSSFASKSMDSYRLFIFFLWRKRNQKKSVGNIIED